MVARPYLTSLILAGTLAGATVAVAAQSSPYPLPTAPAGAAQSQAPPAGPHRNRMMVMLRQLDLSPDQHAKIASMIRDFRASRSSEAPMTRRQLRSNIEAVLTPDQRTKLHGLMRRNRRDPAAPPAST